MKKIIIILILVLPLCIYANSVDLLKEEWLNNHIGLEELIRNLKAEEDSYYQQLNLGRFLFLAGEKEASLQLLEPLYKELQLYAEREESSLAYLLAAEAGSLVMVQKGVTYIIRNSKRVDRLAKRSLELNPGQVGAELIVLSGLINAPKLFGGDRERGMKGLRDLLNRGDLTNLERYEVLNTLISYNKESEIINDYISQIQEMYPNYLYTEKR